MSAHLYYFSGTGNSLWLARMIGDKFGGSELFSIPRVIGRQPHPAGEVIGIVSPIYMFNMPHLVADFIRTIERADYLFFVFAGAGGLGSGVRDTFKVFDSCGLTLSALFNVTMPGNYTPFGCPTEEEQTDLLARAAARVDKIVDTVGARGSHVDGPNTSLFRTWIHPGIMYRWAYSRIPSFDKSFTADEKCTGCSVCTSVCPVGNITLENDRPVWHNRCQQCYACLQWCPVESIQTGERTAGIARYHNPNVSLHDIIESSAGGNRW